MALNETANWGKVPEITLGFWIIKIAATTLGETGGDALSMSVNLGYLASSAIFLGLFIACVVAQIRARRFHPFLYWLVIVATTTAGTTMADFSDRSLGIGYVGGSLLLFVLVLAVLGLWWAREGSVSVSHITTPRVESFYWATILFSNTLGTALGDFAADSGGLGYEGGALVFSAAILLVLLAWRFTRLSPVLLFWAAFILTRPLGATLGDLLTKPVPDGGFDLNRFLASGLIAVFIVLCLVLLPQRAGQHPGAQAA